MLHVLLPPEGTFDPGSFGAAAIQKRKNGDWLGVYDWETLLRTLALLEDKTSFNLPTDFRPLIEACYGDVPLPDSLITRETLTEARALRDERREQSRHKAQTHLVAAPSARGFDYARQPDLPVTEGEEGERASFFRAQTREGDDSRQVLILRDPTLIAAVRQGAGGADWRPGKDRLRTLFLQKAAIPGWWLSKITPELGFEPLNAPRILRHLLILPMPGGLWRGHDDTGKAVTLHDDDTLGLFRS